MTEKRFYIDTIDGGESVLADNGKELSLNETCNLLNELHEENQYLKSLKWNQDCINEISIGIQQRQILERENEYLKRKIQRERNVFMKTQERWSNEAEHKIKELTEENEQLKEEIQFLFNQIKAFRDDCRIYQDFDGASTLNRLIEILEQSKEIFE